MSYLRSLPLLCAERAPGECFALIALLCSQWVAAVVSILLMKKRVRRVKRFTKVAG